MAYKKHPPNEKMTAEVRCPYNGCGDRLQRDSWIRGYKGHEDLSAPGSFGRFYYKEGKEAAKKDFEIMFRRAREAEKKKTKMLLSTIERS